MGPIVVSGSYTPWNESFARRKEVYVVLYHMRGVPFYADGVYYGEVWGNYSSTGSREILIF